MLMVTPCGFRRPDELSVAWVLVSGRLPVDDTLCVATTKIPPIPALLSILQSQGSIICQTVTYQNLFQVQLAVLVEMQ